MSRRPQIRPYLSESLHKRFSNYCASKGATESSVVESALAQYLDGTSDMTLLMRRLDRLGRELGRVERDNSILMEAFATFVQMWFAHTPQIPTDAQSAANRQAMARYRRFVDHVAQQISGGHRFLDDLAKDTLADDDELAKVAAAASTPPMSYDAPVSYETEVMADEEVVVVAPAKARRGEAEL